ncbi:MAG: hypothetical protein JXX14_14140 [Deltaproteobacteria bacterium]|nr:hypothetical protein [Deltaproteobacteria bacterium]
MRKPVLLIAFILATGCQVFTDLDGYTWYSDTDSNSDSTTEHGTGSSDITVVDSDTDSVTNTDTSSNMVVDTNTATDTNTDSVSYFNTETASGFDTDVNTADTDSATEEFSDTTSGTDITSDEDTVIDSEYDTDTADTDSVTTELVDTATDTCNLNSDENCGVCGNDCTAKNQVCDGSDHCVDCVTNSQCGEEPPVCQISQCNMATHTCEFQNTTSVTSCDLSGEEGTCVSGSCMVLREKRIGAGNNFACALDSSGQPICWGEGLGKGSAAPIVSFVTLSVGTDHACGIRADGHAQCWGDNTYGQSTPPQDLAFVQIAAGSDHTCGLTPDGAILCWGSNDWGQSVAPGEVFIDVSAGTVFTCGILIDNTAACWGGGYGQTEAPKGVSFDNISLGAGHTCGVRSLDQQVQCWGAGTPGPNINPPDTAFSSVGLGPATVHSCGIHPNGIAECWGRGPAVDEPIPATAFIELTSGNGFSCGITVVGTIECWGDSASTALDPPSEADY